MDLSIIIDNVVSQLEQVQVWASRAGDSHGDGFLFKLIPRLREYKEAFERKRAVILGQQKTPSVETPIAMDDLMFGQLDDAFWQEIVAGWDLLPPVQ